MEQLAAKVGEILTGMEQTPETDPVAAEYCGRAADYLKVAQDLFLQGAADVAERKRAADAQIAAQQAQTERLTETDQ